MPKTGSSSIQETLCKEKGLGDCEYVKIGTVSNHSLIMYSLFAKQPESHHLHIASQLTKHQVEEFVKYHIEQLSRILSLTCAKQFIISGEDILFLDEDELCALKSFLLEFASEIHVFGYVRPPISFMQSATQEIIKQGDLRFGVAGYYPQYRKRFEKFDRVFGQGNVLLIKFTPDILFSGDVVSDFCHRIGISIENKNIYRVNESFSLEAIALLYVYYKFGGHDTFVLSEQYRKLVQCLSIVGVRKFQYSKLLSDQIRTKIADDIEWMENRMGCSFAEPVTDSDDGISSEEDLIKIAFANKDKLSEFISEEMWQQMVTPQGIADLLCRITFSVDMYHEGYFRGWILDNNNPLQRIMIEIMQEQRVIARGVANEFRQDLTDAGIGDGCCAFVIKADIDWKNEGRKLFLRAVDFDQQFEINTTSIQQCPVKDLHAEHNFLPKVGRIHKVSQNLKDQMERFKARCFWLSGKTDVG